MWDVRERKPRTSRDRILVEPIKKHTHIQPPYHAQHRHTYTPQRKSQGMTTTQSSFQNKIQAPTWPLSRSLVTSRINSSFSGLFYFFLNVLFTETTSDPRHCITLETWITPVHHPLSPLLLHPQFLNIPVSSSDDTLDPRSKPVIPNLSPLLSRALEKSNYLVSIIPLNSIWERFVSHVVNLCFINSMIYSSQSDTGTSSTPTLTRRKLCLLSTKL